MVVPDPDLLKVDASQAKRNFAVWALGKSRDLLVNEIAPYTGTVLVNKRLLLDGGIVLLLVSADGPWSIEITGR